MKNMYILILISGLSLILFLMYKRKQRVQDQPSHVVALPAQPPPPPPEPVYSRGLRKHVVLVDSNTNRTSVQLPYRLRDVVHVELLSGIMPRAEHKVNEYNNVVNDLQVQVGNYSDVLSMLMEINQTLYNAGVPVLFVYDTMLRSTYAILTDPTGVLDLTAQNSLAKVLGFERVEYTEADALPVAPDLSVHLSFFTSFKNSSTATSRSINNRNGSYYTFTDLWATEIPSTWKYILAPKRVNMKHHLYVDIDIDEVAYWGGNNRLARIFIPESTDEVEYRPSLNDPVMRHLADSECTLDKLTVQLWSVVDKEDRHPYDLNGLNFSLMIQITTLDRHL